LIYNGEIYNFQELASGLKNEGIELESSSDTEVLLYLLIHQGTDRALQLVRGMFAFVLYDVQTRRFVAARDHFGQKPLYFASVGGAIAISSEVKGILALTNEFKPNLESFAVYLASNGIIGKRDTFFRGIHTLPAGCIIEGDAEHHHVRQYFDVVDLVDEDRHQLWWGRAFEEAVSELGYHLDLSVSRHLVADVPIGILLSGGIDSSLLYDSSCLQHNTLLGFTKFSSGIEDIPERIVPRLVAERNGELIRSVENKAAYLPGLIDFIAYSCAPSRWGGGPPMRNLCRRARQNGIKVLLGGDGVDEYCAGYQSFERLMQTFDDDFSHLHAIVDLDYAVPTAKSDSCASFIHEQKEVRKRFASHLGHIRAGRERFGELTLLHDTSVFLQSCNLPHSDAYSMAESIELRNPYLDLDLVSFVVNLPFVHKLAAGGNSHASKYIFRQLARRRLGAFVDVQKEGTRNYSMAISESNYWDLANFSIRDLGFDFLPGNRKVMFRMINLELFYRHFFGSGIQIAELLTPQGLLALGTEQMEGRKNEPGRR